MGNYHHSVPMLVGTMRAGAFDPTLALTNAESLTRAIDVYKLFDEDDALASAASLAF